MTGLKTREQGVITVLVALMLTGILSLGTMVLEAGRLQAAKTQLAAANASAGNSMIAAYDSVLYERFGLLSIDTENATVERYRDYLDFNSDLSAGYKGNNISTLYLIESAEMEGMYNLTSPDVLKRQVLARAKYHVIPQEYSFNYYNMDHMLGDIKSKAEYISEALKAVANGSANAGSASDVSADMRAALNSMYAVFSVTKKYDEGYDVTLDSNSISLLPSSTGTIGDSVYAEDIETINKTVSNAQTILGAEGSILASGGSATYNEIDVTVDIDFISNLLSQLTSSDSLCANASEVAVGCRTLVLSINAAMNTLSSDKEGNLLLNSYIAGNFSNKNNIVEGYAGPLKGTAGEMENGTFSGACAEYVFHGDASERVNQQMAYDYVMATRLITNLYSTIQNSGSFDRNNACSVAAHIAWAYYETWADTELLFKYNATVPYAKYAMILPVDNPALVNSAFASRDFLNAMRTLGILQADKFVVDGADNTNYRDALSMALWIVPNSTKMFRIADLIQLEMRYREHYVDNKAATFLMSEQKTFCRVKCVGKMNSILPILSLDGSSGMKGTRIQSVKYIGY